MQRYELEEVVERLLAVVAGKEAAEVVVRNGRMVNITTGTILDPIDLGITHGRIAYVGRDATFAIGPNTHLIDAAGRYIIPGFLDGHLRVDETVEQTAVELEHLQRTLQLIRDEEINPTTAIQMLTIRSADYFGMKNDIGNIALGKYADLLLLSDLTQPQVEQILVNGHSVAKEGLMLVSGPEFLHPSFSRQSVHLPAELLPLDFAIPTSDEQVNSVMARIMQISDTTLASASKQAVLPVSSGFVGNDLQQDVVKIAALERYQRSGNMGLGFVQGFGLKRGAIASTVAHDSRSLLIVGTNDEDMAFAGNELASQGGGMVVVSEGEVLALLPLPIAGLLSDRSLVEVVAATGELKLAWQSLGCELVSPFLTMALLALAVLPDLRLTHRGLIDTNSFGFVDLIVAEAYGRHQV